MISVSTEQFNTIISALSLMVSIASPFIVYRYIEINNRKNQPKLKVIKSQFQEPNRRMWGVIVTNGGILPATSITVVFQATSNWKSPPRSVEIIPPSPYHLQVLTNSVVVKLERALGRDEKIVIHLMDIQEEVDSWVYTDQGEVESKISIGGCTTGDRSKARLTAVVNPSRTQK